MTIDLATLVTILIGSGGVLGLVTSARTIADRRRGTPATTQRALVDLEKRHRVLQVDHDYWRNLAFTRGGQLLEQGIEPAGYPPKPPSIARRSRRRQGQEEEIDE